MKKPARIPILLAAILLLSGCSREVARVGEIRITEKDLSLRAKVSEVYFPGSGKPHVALAQLVKGYLSLAVLKTLNVPSDAAEVEGEARRIDAVTKAPEVLKRIKDVYGDDRKGYLDTFVRIVYAERVLYNEVFLKDRSIHEAQREKAETFLAAAKAKPNVFGTTAKGMGLALTAMTLSGSSPGADTVGIEQAARMISALSGVKPGQVAPAILEWQEGFQVIRLVRNKGGDYLVESVNVPKRAYDDWFLEKASRVPVTVGDPVLRKTFLKEVSWARDLKIDQ